MQIIPFLKYPMTYKEGYTQFKHVLGGTFFYNNQARQTSA